MLPYVAVAVSILGSLLVWLLADARMKGANAKQEEHFNKRLEELTKDMRAIEERARKVEITIAEDHKTVDGFCDRLDDMRKDVDKRFDTLKEDLNDRFDRLETLVSSAIAGRKPR